MPEQQALYTGNAGEHNRNLVLRAKQCVPITDRHIYFNVAQAHKRTFMGDEALTWTQRSSGVDAAAAAAGAVNEPFCCTPGCCDKWLMRSRCAVPGNARGFGTAIFSTYNHVQIPRSLQLLTCFSLCSDAF